MAEENKNTAAEGAEQSAEKTYTEAEYTALQTQLGDVQKQLDKMIHSGELLSFVYQGGYIISFCK